MDELEVLRLSAEGCGKRVTPAWDGPTSRRNEFCLIERWDGDLNGGEWSPFTNDSQRWECDLEIIKRGWYLHYHSYGCTLGKRGEPFSGQIVIDSPLNEASPRALAELTKRSPQ